MVKNGLIAAGACVLAVALLPRAIVESPPIPDPATAGMEKEVANRIQSARRAVEEELFSGDAWGSLGMVFHAHYLEAEAAPCYAEAHRLAPADFRWPYLLARILKTSEPERALEKVDTASRLKSDYAPLHLLAAELRETGRDLKGAKDSYHRALSVDPASTAAEFGLGRLALAEGELVESAKHLERAALLDPEAGSIQAALSQLYRRLGREEDASRAAERARRLHPDVELRDPVFSSVMEEAVSAAGYQMRALEAERAGDPSRAEALLRRAIEIHPEDASLVYNLANHQSRQGRNDEAEESYRRALKLDPVHVGSLVNLGILTAQSDETGEAKRLFKQALEREPRHAGALLGLGNAAATEGMLDAAVSFYERALESDPERPDAHYALARVLAARGAVDDAIAHFTIALERAPERGDIHLHLAALHAMRGERGAAERQIQLARALGVVPSEELLRALSFLSK